MHAVNFETQVAASNLRFGDGVTAEVGMDLKNMNARKVLKANTLNPFVSTKLLISKPSHRLESSQMQISQSFSP